MDTPTFPEAPAKQRLSIEETIARLRQGETSRDVLGGLDDLTRSDAATLSSAWSSLRGETRWAVTRAAVEAAEADVTLQFGRLYRIATTDDDPRTRYAALTGLWEDEGSDLQDVLANLLESDPDTDVRAEAMSLLGKLASQHVDQDETPAFGELRQLVTRYARDKGANGVLRRRAIEAIGAFGAETDVVALLNDAYDDDDTAMKAAALYGMGRTGSQRWSEVLLRELASEDPELRFEAARACGHIGLEDAIPVLGARARDDEDAQARQAAIAALGEIGGAAATRHLRQLAQHAAETDLDEIEAALEESQLTSDVMGAINS